MLAELIRLQTPDGKTHFGAVYPGQGPAPSAIGVVWVHGMTGSFIGELESSLPPLLAEAGYTTLTANNRGNGLLGSATEDFAGCIPDIRAAIDALAERGYKRIALLGHSRGGVKVSYYLSQTSDPRVRGLGILSPAASAHQAPDWIARQFGGEKSEKWLKKALKRARKGQGSHLYTDSAWPYLVSAATLADFGAQDQDDVLAILPALRLPILAACGSLELEWCSVVTELRKRPHPRCQVAVVDGADHIYTGKEADLARLLVDWLSHLS
jgi:alpha-beta hydrolase superfamily lysophospholipase